MFQCASWCVFISFYLKIVVLASVFISCVLRVIRMFFTVFCMYFLLSGTRFGVFLSVLHLCSSLRLSGYLSTYQLTLGPVLYRNPFLKWCFINSTTPSWSTHLHVPKSSNNIFSNPITTYQHLFSQHNSKIRETLFSQQYFTNFQLRIFGNS